MKSEIKGPIAQRMKLNSIVKKIAKGRDNESVYKPTKTKIINTNEKMIEKVIKEARVRGFINYSDIMKIIEVSIEINKKLYIPILLRFATFYYSKAD